MLLVDDLAAGGTKNLRHTPRGLVTLKLMMFDFYRQNNRSCEPRVCGEIKEGLEGGGGLNNGLFYNE